MNHWDQFLESRKHVHLVPLFSTSCKPLALQTCRDIHPCKECMGREGGCKACKKTGVGALKRGTSFVCMVCHKSGKDHYRALRKPTCQPPDPKDEQEENGKQPRGHRFKPRGLRGKQDL